jgi:hypothetical protein
LSDDERQALTWLRRWEKAQGDYTNVPGLISQFFHKDWFAHRKLPLEWAEASARKPALNSALVGPPDEVTAEVLWLAGIGYEGASADLGTTFLENLSSTVFVARAYAAVIKAATGEVGRPVHELFGMQRELDFRDERIDVQNAAGAANALLRWNLIALRRDAINEIADDAPRPSWLSRANDRLAVPIVNPYFTTKKPARPHFDVPLTITPIPRFVERSTPAPQPRRLSLEDDHTRTSPLAITRAAVDAPVVTDQRRRSRFDGPGDGLQELLGKMEPATARVYSRWLATYLDRWGANAQVALHTDRLLVGSREPQRHGHGSVFEYWVVTQNASIGHRTANDRDYRATFIEAPGVRVHWGESNNGRFLTNDGEVIGVDAGTPAIYADSTPWVYLGRDRGVDLAPQTEIER